MKENEIICGDCVTVMRGFSDNSVDLVVTDPPYGMSFMGKEWDKALPPLEAFTEMCRVLKPGALCFVMSSPRQDLMWRMMKLLEDAGFEMKQSFISWIYKTGFPKAYDVSKGIDKRFGLDRKVIGKKKGTGKQNPEWNGTAKGRSENYLKPEYNDTIPASDEAKQWEGWKSQTSLKPATEPILMVNKPLSEKTIVDNVLKWGTGAMNVDACRIPIGKNESVDDFERTIGGFQSKSEIYHNDPKYQLNDFNSTIKGRFPANLLVSDGALDTGEISKSSGGINEGKLGVRIYGNFENKSVGDNAGGLGDVGDQSRYFDLDAWAQHHGLLDVPKPDNKERDYGLKNKKQKASKMGEFKENPGRTAPKTGYPRRNIHPTVKPIKLMAYLIELGCPPGGIVLDPFVGSGTTCIAAKQLQRKYIGIELDENYHRLAEARLAAYPDPIEWFKEEKEK